MTDLVETVARAMARRIIEREASKVTSRGLPEDVMQRSIDRMWGKWCADDARTAIEAIEASGTHRLAPVNPTEEMEMDGKCELIALTSDLATSKWAAHKVYKAMIEKAPKVIE